MLQSSTAKNIIKAGLTGISAYFGANFINSAPANVSVKGIGVSLNENTAIGLVAGGSSLAANGLESIINQFLPAQGVLLNDNLSYLYRPLIVGGSTVAGASLLLSSGFPTWQNAVKLGAIGAGSEIISNYASNSFIFPALQRI